MKTTGVIHMHSTYSYDGKVSLSDLKTQLQEAGIRFACMSEHTDEMTPEQAVAFVNECRALSDESFVFVPGFEVPYHNAHILMLGATEFVSQEAVDPGLLNAWAQKAALVVLAHPVRNHFVVDEAMLQVLDGVEVWNQQYDGKRVPRIKAWRLFELLRHDVPALIATGGLDYHRSEHLTFPLVTMEVGELSEEEILETLHSGVFSFGNRSWQVNGKGEWMGNHSVVAHVVSFTSIGVINLGKWVNKRLKKNGLTPPTWLRQAIRRRV